MGDPASQKEFRRTCPACKTPAKPGFKFCEVCGTRIPELLTCSHCGTQFVATEKFCDLCGAPLVIEEIPEQDGDAAQEPDAEETTGPAEEEMPEDYEGDVPAPDEDEVSDRYDEDTDSPAEKKRPKHYSREIVEPDTDEIMEKYWDGEAQEPGYGKKPTSPSYPPAKKQVTAPIPRGGRSSDTINGALFLLDEKKTAAKPAKKPINWVPIIGGAVVVIAIVAAVYFIGLPMLADNEGSGVHSSVTVADITSLPEQAGAGPTGTIPTTISTPASGSLVPQPTQIVPPGQNLYFEVKKSPITSKILIIFAGSAGHGSISSADVTITHPDGSVATGIILPLKGVTEIILDGSKETDRVVIIAKMSSGENYRVYDALVP